jgi:hypothetical protein
MMYIYTSAYIYLSIYLSFTQFEFYNSYRYNSCLVMTQTEHAYQLDNLRIFLTVLVIWNYHAVIPYGGMYIPFPSPPSCPSTPLLSSPLPTLTN